MEQLSTRFYPREEIGEIIGVDTHAHNFARKIKDTLTLWGYSYNYKTKGVTILSAPATVEDRIAEKVYRLLKLDVRCDKEAFAAFLFLLQYDEEFQTCPWDKRVDYMKQELGIEVSVSSLRRWAKKLMDNNLMIKSEEKELWCTVCFNGNKIQEPVLFDADYFHNKDEYEEQKKEINKDVKDDTDAYRAFCETRKQLMNENVKNGLDPWHGVFYNLFQRHKCCYYYCKGFNLNAIVAEELKEMFDMVEDLYIFDKNKYVRNPETAEVRIFN